mgnify:CR=1 FL=1
MTLPLHRITLLALVLGLVVAFALPGRAQGTPPRPAMLVADDVYLQGDTALIAEGNVEALYDGRRLQAARIVYDRETETLQITGPITLQDTQGRILVLADSASLDRKMENGLLTGARVVMDDQLQLAAHEMNRVNGQYSQLYKAAVTSCQVCGDGRPPLWQIRARRVIHDQEAQQLYFDQAQFRVLDTPIFYLPRLRLPDPTLKRATGFLVPSVVNSSLLGTGLKVPYFIKLGDHADLTLTPFLATKTSTLEYRYRQAFRKGEIEFTGAVSDDDLGTRSVRSYLFGSGRFDLPRDFQLTFDVEAVNDDTYLLDYSYSDKDRLNSQIAVERVRRDEYIRGALTHFRSLRIGESNDTLPTFSGDAEYERRLFPARFGGELVLGTELHGHGRTSSLASDGADFDPWGDGSDLLRLTARADWSRSWTLPAGVRARLQAGLAGDSFFVNQGGPASASQTSELTPSTAVQLRWPVLKRTMTGATHLVEPMVQLSWSGGSNSAVPNDESTHVEFDEGNLLSLSRFPEADRRERGYAAALGVSWTRLDPNGWDSTLLLGQVMRDDQLTEVNGTTSFSESSGLESRWSDVLLAGQLKAPGGLNLTARGLFDDDYDTTKAELRAGWQNDLADLGATYIWLGRDTVENRDSTISEWSIEGSYRLSQYWTGSANWRYDVESDRNVTAGVGVTYTNECVEATLSASRRFTSSTILEPSTDISLTVALRGFTIKAQEDSYARTCRN